MNDAATAESGVHLRDGSRAVIRPIAPDDKELVRAGFARLSPDSRYRRFLTPMTHLSEQQLAWQGRGLGTALLRAAASGVAEFVAHRTARGSGDPRGESGS